MRRAIAEKRGTARSVTMIEVIDDRDKGLGVIPNRIPIMCSNSLSLIGYTVELKTVIYRLLKTGFYSPIPVLRSSSLLWQLRHSEPT